MLERGPESIAMDQRKTFEKFMSESAICCLTKTADNLLLWAHYGDSHRGVCFVFEEMFKPPTTLFIGYDVEYSNERPEIDVTSFGGNLNAFKQSVLTKANDWAYEQEKRFIDYRKPAGLRTFPPAAFKGIIFGARTSEPDKNFILELLERRGGDPEVWEASVSPTEFRIEIAKY